ncbi:MAG TPA: HEAT repeat domain-containing protein [Thermoanaerobaculia bacterium]
MLLTESIDPARRELTHEHIESCEACTAEWLAYKETWNVLDELPEVEVPARVKQRFLAAVNPQAVVAPVVAPAPAEKADNVVPFTRKPAFKWVAQAAAVALLVGGSYFAGQRTATPEPAPMVAQQQELTPARINSVQEFSPVSMSLAETRVLDASTLSPNIEGRPDITNVKFVDADPSDDAIGVSFDITSRWTVKGSPNDKSMVRLLSYVLESEGQSSSPRSDAIDWVRQTYSDPQYSHPEIANALAKVLRTDDHEGARINAVDTLKTLPASSTQQTREALIEALKSDPNPAVRMKAVDALAKLAAAGERLDPAALDMLRQKAGQADENVYVRVKAAEALGNIRP